MGLLRMLGGVLIRCLVVMVVMVVGVWMLEKERDGG